MAYPIGVTSARANAFYAAYIAEDMLELVQKTMVMDQFGTPEDIPGNFSDAIQFNRIRKLGKKTSQLAETANRSTVDPSELVIDKMSTTLERYGDYAQLTKKNVKVEVHKSIDMAKEVFAIQAKETIDWQIMINVAPFLRHFRQDADSTYEKFDRTVNSAIQATTTTARTNLTEVDSFWVGAYITGKTGAWAGITRKVSAFANANGLLTFDAFPVVCSNNDTFDICMGTAIDELDVLTADTLNRLEMELFEQGTQPVLIGSEGSYYAVVMSNKGRYDYRKDPTWVTAHQYTEKGLEDFRKGIEGKLYGCLVYKTNQPYRESVAGVQSDTGIVHNTLLIGKNCYATSRLRNADGSGIAALQVWLKTPGDNTLEEPFNSIIAQPSWEVWFKTLVTNSLWGATVLHGSTFN